MRKSILTLVGPTCVGKTTVGVTLAQRMGAEILSADSRQVYRFMDIGTAKPTHEERQLVAHHLIDVLDPDEPFNAGAYGDLARKTLDGLTAGGVPALIVGGAGLYLKALEGGLFSGPELPTGQRERVRLKLEAMNSLTLHGRLRHVDPDMAERLHPNDRQRVVRAIEVFEITGTPLTVLHQARAATAPTVRFHLIGLDRPRNEVYERIQVRVQQMISDGLVGEVEGLIERGYTADTWALKTFGYAEILAYLEGRLSLTAAVDKIAMETRRYAKRQWTWFRGRSDVEWLTIGQHDTADEVCDRIQETVASSPC